MQNTERNKLIALVALAVVFLAVIIYISLFAVSRSGKTPLTLSAFPNDMTITVDGTAIKTGTTYLSPGTYLLEAKKDGYDSFSKTLVLEETKQTVAIILIPNSDEAFEYGRKNEKEYRKIQANAEVAAAEAGKLFNKLNPIARNLPYKTFFYSVGYRMDRTDPSGNSILIEIDAAEGYRQSAIYRIRQLGYDPTDFTINFRDYENPFAL